jgi:hypothetical protein
MTGGKKPTFKIKNMNLLHRVAPPLHADRLGPVVLLDISGLVGLGLLIVGLPLLIAPCLSGAPCKRAGTGTDGGPFTGFSSDSPHAQSDQCTTRRPANRAPAFRSLLRCWCLSLGGIEAGLIDGPLVTLELVLFLLIGALTLGWIDDGILSQDKPGEYETYEHRKEM